MCRFGYTYCDVRAVLFMVLCLLIQLAVKTCCSMFPLCTTSSRNGIGCVLHATDKGLQG